MTSQDFHYSNNSMSSKPFPRSANRSWPSLCVIITIFIILHQIKTFENHPFSVNDLCRFISHVRTTHVRSYSDITYILVRSDRKVSKRGTLGLLLWPFIYENCHCRIVRLANKCHFHISWLSFYPEVNFYQAD